MVQNNEIMTVPYIVYESMLNKEDRQQKRMVCVVIGLIILLVVTNAMWLVAWNQYDYVDDYTSYDLDSGDGGDINYIGNDGDIYNGESEGNTQNEIEDAS